MRTALRHGIEEVVQDVRRFYPLMVEHQRLARRWAELEGFGADPTTPEGYNRVVMELQERERRYGTPPLP